MPTTYNGDKVANGKFKKDDVHGSSIVNSPDSAIGVVSLPANSVNPPPPAFDEGQNPNVPVSGAAEGPPPPIYDGSSEEQEQARRQVESARTNSQRPFTRQQIRDSLQELQLNGSSIFDPANADFQREASGSKWFDFLKSVRKIVALNENEETIQRLIQEESDRQRTSSSFQNREHYLSPNFGDSVRGAGSNERTIKYAKAMLQTFIDGANHNRARQGSTQQAERDRVARETRERTERETRERAERETRERELRARNERIRAEQAEREARERAAERPREPIVVEERPFTRQQIRDSLQELQLDGSSIFDDANADFQAEASGSNWFTFLKAVRKIVTLNDNEETIQRLIQEESDRQKVSSIFQNREHYLPSNYRDSVRGAGPNERAIKYTKAHVQKFIDTVNHHRERQEANQQAERDRLLREKEEQLKREKAELAKMEQAERERTEREGRERAERERNEREQAAQAEHNKAAEQNSEPLRAEQTEPNKAIVQSVEPKKTLRESIISEKTLGLATLGGIIAFGISVAIMGFVWPIAVIAAASALVFGALKVAYDYRPSQKTSALASANQQENAAPPALHASATAIQPNVVPNTKEEQPEGPESEDNRVDRPRGNWPGNR